MATPAAPMWPPYAHIQDTETGAGEMRAHVWLPDKLAAEVAERVPGVNLSKVLQEALRGVLGCQHVELVCQACAEPIDRWTLRDEWLDRFYGDVLARLDDLVRKGGTAEGAARVLKDVAGRHQIPAAERLPLPRPTRAAREATSRSRHPAGRPPAAGALEEETA